MTDGSFTGWHVRLRCDAPGHKPIDPSVPDICDDDLFTAKADYVAFYRGEGWIFHRGGHLTCPECAAQSTGRANQDGGESL